MKYIDAEKLIAEIDRRKNNNLISAKKCPTGYFSLVANEDIEILDFITSLQQEQPLTAKKVVEQCKKFGGNPEVIQPEVDLFECPKTSIKDAIEVTSRMKYIDEELKPIAEFIMDYASWNLHKNEWSQPVIEVPLFRVLDALAQKGKPYCGA